MTDTPPNYPDRGIESDALVIAAEKMNATQYMRICGCTLSLTQYPLALARGGKGMTDDGRCTVCDEPIRAFTVGPPTFALLESGACEAHAIVPTDADWTDAQYNAVRARAEQRENAQDN